MDSVNLSRLLFISSADVLIEEALQFMNTKRHTEATESNVCVCYVSRQCDIENNEIAFTPNTHVFSYKLKITYHPTHCLNTVARQQFSAHIALTFD